MFHSAFKWSAAASAAFLAAGLFPSLAEAAAGFSTANVNMRSGPSTRYPAVTVIPAGASVEIHGCLAEVPWCDVSFRYGRGWVAGRYLQTIYRERRVYLAPEYYRPLGIPTVTFDVDTYWTRNYRSRDFYRERDYWREWRGGWRDDRPLPPRPRWEPDRPRWEQDRPRWDRDRDRERDRQNWERDRQQNWERDRENRDRDQMNRERDRENRELDQRNRELDRQNRERDRQNFERDHRQREWDNRQQDRDQRGEREMRDRERDRQNWDRNPDRDNADRARIRRPENGACAPDDPACAR